MANNNHFELTLDTLAPSGSISGLNEFEKANKVLTIDGGDATFKKVWFDGLDENEVSKECDGYKAAEWEAKELAVTSAFNATGTYYYHLVLMDEVNNESEIYTLGPVNYDQDAPVVSNVIVKDSRGNTSNTNEVTLTLSFDYTDIVNGVTGTGVQKAVISGDVVEKTIELVASNDHYEGTITLKADEVEGIVVDGNKSITVVVYDAADNVSAPATSNVILLDRELDKPVLLITNTETGTNLPEYINYKNFTAKLTSNEPNIVAYKIWEGDAAAGEGVAWVSQEMGALDVEVDMTFSDGDGLKTINAAIKDVAGNTEFAAAKTTTVDTVAPVAEIATDVAIISKVAGKDKATLTFGATADNENGSGIEYYEIRRNGTQIAFGAEVPANYEVTVGTLADGLYNYTIMVRDRAQNVTESAVATIKVDTTAPTLSITQLNPWYTAKFDVNVTYSDASALSSMSVWSSTVADDTTLPENKISIAPATTISSANVAWNLAESNANYIHVMLVDEVGNTSFAHCQFGYDTVAPEIKSCTFTEEAYPSVAATINLTYEDATSGVVEMRVSGDVTNGTPEGTWETVVGTRNVTLTEKDGIKTVLVEIRDEAGLTASKTITCELDTTIPMPVLNVYEADLTTTKAANSAVASFGLKLEVVGAEESYEEDFVGGVEYKLYGDFNYGSQSEAGIANGDAEWKAFVKDEGKTYMTISDLYCTTGDGTKNIYVAVRDNAGNTYTLTDPKSFVYDTTAPLVAVSDIDFNRISKVNVERRNAAGIIVGKYADEVYFTLKPDSVIQAYKVCAYLNASAAAAVTDVAAEVAIGNANGSLHMADTGLKSDAAITAKIKGADYEAALGGSDENPVDGAHIVVVYVQDLAGTWSVAAQF